MSFEANKAYGPRTYNYTMLQAFEWYVEGGGKHFKKLTEQMPYLDEMGITALWLPPPTKAAGPNSVGYDIYDLWDLGEFNQKGATQTYYGTKEDLLEAISKAKELGMVVYLDAVLNHKFGADHTELFAATQVAWDDRNKSISERFDIEGWTAFEFPGRGDKYSSFKWNFNHFTGVDYNSKADAEANGHSRNAIFQIYGKDKTWARQVDKEKGSYDYLMGADVDHAHPDVANDLKAWGTWILKETGADGFRFDAIKHIDEGFLKDFVGYVRGNSDKSKMFCVGEYWKDSTDDLAAYLGNFGQQLSVFDTPLHYNFKEAGDRGNSFDLRAIWDGTLVQRRPIDACTLVDNHDTQIGQGLESWVASWFKPLAYALILLRIEGYPCVFYGDLYGCGGKNPQQPMSQLADFVRARKLLAYGEVHDYWDYPNCVGWIRTGDDDHDGCAVVICNGDQQGTKWMEVGYQHAGEKWTDVLGWSQGEITIPSNGWAEFRCPARSVSIWAKEDARGREEFGKN